ncbi:MAG: helix-turn-helix domain-containing protein [Pseudonocardia sp.]
MALADERAGRTLSDSEREWLQVRGRLQQRRYELGVEAANLYPATPKVEGTPLLTHPLWIPPKPLALDAIDLFFEPDRPFHGLTGDEEEIPAPVLPMRPDRTRYARYSEAMAELAAPPVFENRPTYRLLEADLTGERGRLTFGRGCYFDGVDVGESAGHEYAAGGRAWREMIGDPCDLSRRPTNMAITTLTIRHDHATGDASYLVHRRDPAKVGHAGGLYQLVPVGVFQPADNFPKIERNDFSLWRLMLREFAEELLGVPELTGLIDYERWPFAQRMAGASAYCLGLGVDPLTLATDLLTVVVIDGVLFDDVLGNLVQDNAEGHLVARRESFNAAAVARFSQVEPVQAAGAAALRLTWLSRRELLSGS